MNVGAADVYARYCSYLSSLGKFGIHQRPFDDYVRRGRAVVAALNAMPRSSLFKPGELP